MKNASDGSEGPAHLLIQELINYHHIILSIENSQNQLSNIISGGTEPTDGIYAIYIKMKFSKFKLKFFIYFKIFSILNYN